ncbi:TetR/AcrR family transcriptional regulator [Phaeobacter sp. HF9A]|uniref:TetR/AcrR family transcriptional regulator n=1 Tax=Phaeobacter sp. HF9A TaxID=2721561 RepID=UPI0014302854|nr:TetR/AcrR family transcriptional regulator [Phaeobacter sp. HF9A]NIZ12134.1 TetR/AcrR family transcriptional regulator [Phaeobacter sp. HF9A]
MSRAPQKRRLETRAKLLSVAEHIIDTEGCAALRMEEVAAKAGVAKGTLFSHFGDKEGLLAVIFGARVMGYLDQMEAMPDPDTPDEIASRLAPLLDFVAQDRMIFELLLRYSGTTSENVDEVITQGFIRQVTLCAGWITGMQQRGRIRDDQDPVLLAEGVQAFLTHVLAIGFCQEHAQMIPPAEAMLPYLRGWLDIR